MNSRNEDSADYLAHNDTTSSDFYIGLGLAVSSSVFIGASFIIKKKALIKLQKYGGLRAGSGGYGYLRESIWWAGLLSMGVGEAANFAAYAFAPATLVTPLGVLSVLVSSILASHYLNERLNLLGKIGCLLCMLGSTVLVLHSPREENVDTMDDLAIKIQDSTFIAFILSVIIVSSTIIFYFAPLYGKNHIIVYILLCSAIGSITVMSCKGLGVAVRETMNGNSQMGNKLTWSLLFILILCVMIQMNYLNKSLDLFNTSIVTPIYYVFFTMFVIIASAILFREWESMSNEDLIGCFCGFLIVITAIFLLNAFKDVDLSYTDVKQIFRPKRELIPQHNPRWTNNHEDGQLRFDLDLDYGSNFTRSM
ncbi:hypothetical protein QAD02_003841 [Eretmocerus hayati]|uniref:Uncharacterized protein n=1 Tax=Eretmocerus hayati TaxID=131215 RepID=A0ACC2NQP6_9HYME|nr:hypothetical protein QAD02_003841 [Eretmocerus hayati]